jgi:hypothetical protein
LKNMEVYFRIDPFLTKIEVGWENESEKGKVFLRSPIPSSIQGGEWSWIEKSGDAWNEMELRSVSQNAEMSGIEKSVRAGWLRLGKEK